MHYTTFCIYTTSWYHSGCYKNFTAISKPKSKPKTNIRSTKISRQSKNKSPLLPSATGVLPPICIYFVIKKGTN